MDNAATSQTPQQVIDVIVDYYSNYNANIHRGVHALSQEATDVYELARTKITNHFNAKHNRVDRQIDDIKRLDAFRSDEHNKKRLEKVDANTQININYLRKKELEDLYSKVEEINEILKNKDTIIIHADIKKLIIIYIQIP